MSSGIDHDIEVANEEIAPQKTAVIDTKLQSPNVYLSAFREMRLLKAGSINEKHYTLYWFGKLIEQRWLHGTGCAVHNSIAASTESPCAVSERISLLSLYTKQGILEYYVPLLNSDSWSFT